MVHLNGGVRRQRHLLLEGFLLRVLVSSHHVVVAKKRLVLSAGFLSGVLLIVLALLYGVEVLPTVSFYLLVAVGLLLEPLVGFLQERHVVVELLHVELSVDVYLTVVGDVVAKRRSVLKVSSSCPVIRGVVRSVRRNPVEYGQEIYRQLV